MLRSTEYRKRPQVWITLIRELVRERGIGCLRVIILRVTGTTRLIEASSTRREVMRMENGLVQLSPAGTSTPSSSSVRLLCVGSSSETAHRVLSEEGKTEH
jgi:hypothetical protein